MTDLQPSMSFDIENAPEILPILPTFDAALFPKMVLPVVVTQNESIKQVDEAMTKDRIIGLLVVKKRTDKSPKRSMIFIISEQAP